MSFFDGKIDTFSSIISCNDGAVFIFFFIPLSGVLAKEQLLFHKGDRWSKLTLGRFICRSLLQSQNTFDFFSKFRLIPWRGRRQQHQQRGNITAYFLFLWLADPDNCEHVKGVTGKRIHRMPLFFFFFFYTTLVSFQLHHVCTLRARRQSLR